MQRTPLAVLALLLALPSPALAQAVTPPTAAPARFDVVEATIADIQDAMRAGTLGCRALVQEYLRRIDAYDKNGPAINAITCGARGRAGATGSSSSR